MPETSASTPLAAPTRCWPTTLVLGSLMLHTAALLVFVREPAWWPWALAAVAADHLLLVAAGLCPRSRLLGPNITRLPDDAALRGEIALTFDDGPDPETTPAVLDLLDAYGARATFFCIGERARRHPALCREILRRGHAVENHSEHHRRSFSLLGPRAYVRELRAAQQSCRSSTGQEPRFFRAPAGLRNLFLAPVLAALDLRLVTWTRRGYDTRERDPDKVTRRLLRNLRAGDILLLHDGHAARMRDGRPVILNALPQVLEAVCMVGLKPVTLRSACTGIPISVWSPRKGTPRRKESLSDMG